MTKPDFMAMAMAAENGDDDELMEQSNAYIEAIAVRIVETGLDPKIEEAVKRMSEAATGMLGFDVHMVLNVIAGMMYSVIAAAEVENVLARHALTAAVNKIVNDALAERFEEEGDEDGE